MEAAQQNHLLPYEVVEKFLKAWSHCLLQDLPRLFHIENERFCQRNFCREIQVEESHEKNENNLKNENQREGKREEASKAKDMLSRILDQRVNGSTRVTPAGDKLSFVPIP